MATLAITPIPAGEARRGDINNAFTEIANVVNALDNSNISSTAAIELSKLAQSGAVTGDYMQWTGSSWEPANVDATVISGTPAEGDIARYDGVNWAAFQPPACRAVRSSAQVLSNDTATAIQFNATDTFDTGSLHSPSANNTRVTVPIAGIYEVAGNARFDEAPEEFELYIRANGSTEYAKAIQAYDASTTADVALSVSDHIALSASGYVELIARHSDSGGVSNSVLSAALSVAWVSHV